MEQVGDRLLAKLNDIPHSRDFISVIPIEKGWSSDKKYYIETAGGSKLLLRTADISKYERKKAEYEALKLVAAQGVPMCQPVDFGLCNDRNNVFTLLTWVDGQDAEAVVPKLSHVQQYKLGLEAGRLLAKIHTLPAPSEQEPWEERFNRKTDLKIAKYNQCGIRFSGDTLIINYLEQNKHLLNDRPQCFQHGDYHLGNMIINPSGKLTIIDFNRFDYGDPWEEFNRIVWCAENSSYFATGRINGYFTEDVPEKFFRLLAFYIASNTLSSVYWAIPFGRSQIDTMLQQAGNILLWFNDMTSPVPSWYQQERR